MKRRPVVEMALLATIVVVATALRVHALDAQLWVDEMISVVRYRELGAWQLATTYDSETHHVLYTLLARLSTWMFGVSPAPLRAPAMLFGVASLVATYLVGRRLRTARDGLLAAALLAVSYHHIWFSQNARGYTALLFWTLVASLLLLRAFGSGSRQSWIAYAVVCALGAYTHLTMLFVVAGHFLIALRRRVGPRGLALGFGLTAVLVAALYAPILPQVLERIRIAITHSDPSAWSRPGWTGMEVLRAFDVALRNWIGVLGAALLLGAGLWQLSRERSLLLELLFLPCVIGGAAMLLAGYRLWPRLFFFALGFAALVVVAGAFALGQAAARLLGGRPERGLAVGTALCLVLIAGSALSVPRAYRPKQDFLGALELVERERRPGDAAVVTGSAHWVADYYGVDFTTVRSADALTRIRRDAERTWILYTLPVHLEGRYPEIKRIIDQDFETVGEFDGTLGGGNVVVCRSEKKP